MKKVLFISIFAILAIGFYSCEKLYISPEPQDEAQAEKTTYSRIAAACKSTSWQDTTLNLLEIPKDSLEVIDGDFNGLLDRIGFGAAKLCKGDCGSKECKVTNLFHGTDSELKTDKDDTKITKRLYVEKKDQDMSAVYVKLRAICKCK